ncbi:MAG: hypothetical protein KJ955_01240 [Nanoarchaeota archaeon]|nr:hypothetical protein [Nanoarchaeota archaeon]
MKQWTIFTLSILILSSLAIAAEDLKSDVIGVAVEFTVKDTGEVTLDSQPELVEGYPDHKLQPEDGFNAKVLSVKGEEIYSFNFSVEFWFYDNPTILTEKPVLIIFPYYRNVQEAKIYDKEDKLVLTVDLSGYTTCNENAVCNIDIGENEELCPSDCKTGEAEAMEAEQAAAEETVSGELVEGAGEKPVSSLWLIVLLVVILIAIIIGLVRTKKKD